MGIEYIALGIAILVHIVGTVWWASDMNTRMKHLEERTKSVDDLNIKMAKLEVVTQQLVNMTQSTNAAVQTIKDFLINKGEGSEAHRQLKQLSLDN